MQDPTEHLAECWDARALRVSVLLPFLSFLLLMGVLAREAPWGMFGNNPMLGCSLGPESTQT